MGRKGDSKRKPKQPKDKPFSTDKVGSSGSAVGTLVETQAVKSNETRKPDPMTGGKKPSKKG